MTELNIVQYFNCAIAIVLLLQCKGPLHSKIRHLPLVRSQLEQVLHSLLDLTKKYAISFCYLYCVTMCLLFETNNYRLVDHLETLTFEYMKTTDHKSWLLMLCHPMSCSQYPEVGVKSYSSQLFTHFSLQTDITYCLMLVS